MATPAWLKPVWELVVHVLVGSLLFTIIFAPAVGLDLLVRWLKTSTDVSEFLVGLLRWTKYVIAVIDAFLYIAFMLNMAWQFMKELWGEKKHE